ncbi:hypothetical protein EVAR_30711_1 [Eumeta japonica]|uniref:Uncharacterized protein n=1 Tax=Eumeta variegata TaxID=151549 RepID=A0A4C1V6L4_EUMVA|nr:hypothetical protein EVAR_30711_1 [Eumeta japonica]
MVSIGFSRATLADCSGQNDVQTMQHRATEVAIDCNNNIHPHRHESFSNHRRQRHGRHRDHQPHRRRNTPKQHHAVANATARDQVAEPVAPAAAATVSASHAATGPQHKESCESATSTGKRENRTAAWVENTTRRAAPRNLPLVRFKIKYGATSRRSTASIALFIQQARNKAQEALDKK